LLEIIQESCQVEILINDGTTKVLLHSLADDAADPQSNGIDIKSLSEGLPTE
jgi:hypothetical protein